ncbi:hypothetical protein BDZ85DRAFT_29683 [Elsinoe ampelina]|uniref:SnoaL-like domain-containing protein n=1 Tax=Elsinoe ampelina TaxID=302913 RepID=A0A6A6G5I8_9PEZI|nr:hypothetical protein BDZ85DRAFT_29683 [Elsinoe ampelina]
MPTPAHRIHDWIQIQDLYATYIHAVDDHDWALLGQEVFTLETLFDWSASGGPRLTWSEIRATPYGGFPMAEWFPYGFHVCTNLVIDFVKGNGTNKEARVKSKTIHPSGLPKEGGGDAFFQVQGVYKDVVVKTESGWRFKERRWEDGFVMGVFTKLEGMPEMMKAAGKSIQ